MNHLLIVDPQNDFTDVPTAALPVGGAYDDLRRLANFIRDHGSELDAITVTLDSHNPADIAHAVWWQDAEGQPPKPFTAITALDVESGRWRTSDPLRQAASLAYVRALESSGKYVLVIWPEHCLVGSWGHSIHAAVKAELDAWSRKRLKAVEYVFKGMNPGTEHYSAVRAEVPDPADPATQVNAKLVGSIAAASHVYVAGEALSHCVAATVSDLEEQIPGLATRLTLLSDATSPVRGFESLGDSFVRTLRAKGMTLTTTERAFS